MTPYIDFHSHHPSREEELVIQDGVDTWGIHPWTLAVPSHEPDNELVAIGECGLDKLCSTPYEAQEQAFRQCITKSEQLRKPLFLHCVRAIDDCLRLRQEMNASQPWVWHGFRGGVIQMQQLLSHGFYFSFGFNFQAEALRLCPTEALLLETDADPQPVRLLYQQAADLRGISIDTLCAQMRQNYERLFTT